MKKLLLIVVLLCSVAVQQALSTASTKARTMNGTSDYMQSASAIDLDASGVITLCFRAYIESDSDAGGRMVFELGPDSFGSSNPGTFSIYLAADGKMYFNVMRDAGGGGDIPRPSLNAWHQYCFSMDASVTNAVTVVARVDGAGVTYTPNGASSNTGGNFSASHVLNVGNRNAGASHWFPGRMSEIAIWQGALSTAQMDTYTVCGDPGAIGTVLYWWPIVQASPETASAGGINLTVSGTSNSDSPCLGGGGSSGGKLLLLGVGL